MFAFYAEPLPPLISSYSPQLMKRIILHPLLPLLLLVWGNQVVAQNAALPTSGKAQPLAVETMQPLTLTEAVQRAETQSAVLRVADVEHRISVAQFRQTDAVFLPQISVGYTAMLTNNPLNAFGFLLQQRGVTMASFNPETLNHPTATDNYTTSLEVKLPLLNLDMIYARKGARAMAEVNRHKADYVRSNLRFEIQKAYTQLQFAHRAKAVLEVTLKDVQTIRNTVADFEAQGLVQRSDVLNAQVQVNTIEAALAKAQSHIFSASEGLALLMGVKHPKGNVYLPEELEQSSSEVIGEFTSQRADVRAMTAALEATQQMERSARAAFLPKINAFGTYQLNNNRPLAFKHDAYLLGVNLTWPVFQGNQARYKALAAHLQTDKMREELQLHMDRSRVEVDKLRRDILDWDVEITKQKTSLAQADEALRIVRHRHAEGLASTTDLLMAQAQLSQQQLGLAQTIMNRNIAGYQYQLLTSFNE